MSSSTVHVEGIAASITEKEVRDFFSFCGKISSLSVTPTSSAADSPKSATVTFEKDSAAKTALLLDNTQLGPSQVHVKAAASLSELAGDKAVDPADLHDVPQEEKPRGRIIAEYLAHGYVISDKVIEKALALDKQHGISSRFTKALTDFDSKYKATEKVQAADQKYAVSKSATNAWSGFNSYFDKALSGPRGQQLRAFYAEGNKNVMDVHNEARHLANLKKTAAAPATTETVAESSTAAPAAVPVAAEKSTELAAPTATTAPPAAPATSSEKQTYS